MPWFYFVLVAFVFGQSGDDCNWSVTDNGEVQLSGRTIFSEVSGKILYIGSGNLEITDERGYFFEKDYTESRIGLSMTENKFVNNRLLVNFEMNFALEMHCSNSQVRLIGTGKDLDRWWLRIHAEDSDEAVYGGGEQFSYLNLRGHRFEMLTREQGMGRNDSELVSWGAERLAQAKGQPSDTYWPQPTFVVMNAAKNKHFFIHSWHDEYSILDFTNGNFHEIEFHSDFVDDNTDEFVVLDIGVGDTFQEVVQAVATLQGDQLPLPKWAVDGTILGLQGGTELIDGYYENATRYDVAVRGIWIQDWSGQIFTDFGDRVFWNWEWNETMYPRLDEKIVEYREKGVYFLNYLNPHLLNTETSKLFLEGSEKGYFVKNKTTGGDLLQEFGFAPFKVVTIDLSNPEAAEWFKQKVIIENSLNFGFCGWMADFGEYLPYSEEALFWDGSDGRTWHNKFPERWAALNMEALIETGKLGECFYFSRAGWTGMRGSTTSAWAGDQNVDFSYGDGLATTIAAALSLGISGSTGLTHFDIGGYTGADPILNRRRELFLRSAEAAIFTPVMRTHEGNQPANFWQFYSTRCTMRLYSRLVSIHRVLVPYIQALMEENTELGSPVQRPMLWVADDIEEQILVRDMKFQYMLGNDMVVAPVIRSNVTTQNVFIPNGTWLDIWNPEQEFQGPAFYPYDSELGFPPAFFRKNSAFEDDFVKVSKFYGELPCNTP